MDKFEHHIKRMKGLRDVYEVGTGQHNILSMLIKECEEALRQPPVIRQVCTIGGECKVRGENNECKGTAYCGYKKHTFL